MQSMPQFSGPQQTHDPTADNIGTADTALASAMDNFGLNEKVS